MSTNPVSVMGVGFVGGAYCQTYPEETVPEPRDALVPSQQDVLYTISTVSNYNILQPSTLKLDVETNLMHLLDVLPNVRESFTFLSSWFVMADAGQSPGAPAHEDSPCDPNGLYSITKLAAEKVVRSYCMTAAAGLVKGPRSYRILRLCNVIGNDPRAGKQKNALEHLLKAVVHNEPLSIYEGDNYRNYLHVSDVCRAIHLCLSREDTLNGIINIGAPESVRLLDLIEYAKERVGSTSVITRVPVPYFHRIVQVPDFWMDTTKLQSLGFVPQMNAYQAVDAVLEGILREEALGKVADYLKATP